MEHFSYHPSYTYNSEVASRFCKALWIPHLFSELHCMFCLAVMASLSWASLTFNNNDKNCVRGGMKAMHRKSGIMITFKCLLIIIAFHKNG